MPAFFKIVSNAVQIPNLTHGDHSEVRSRIGACSLKGFHVKRVVGVAVDHSVVNALLLLKLEPRHEV